MASQKHLVLYKMPVKSAWHYFQYTYERREEDKQKMYISKRYFFSNALITFFAQVEHSKEARHALLESLVEHINRTRRADGFESILLTLLFAIHSTEHHRELVRCGMKAWVDYASKPCVSGTGPFLFYNVHSKVLYFFSAKVALEFLRCANMEDLQGSVKQLESQALDGLQDPFITPRNNMTWLRSGGQSSGMHVLAAPASGWTSHNRDIAQDMVLVAGAAAAAGGLIIAVAGTPVVLVGVTAFAAGFAIGAAIGILWNDLDSPEQPAQPATPPAPQPTNVIPPPQPSDNPDNPDDPKADGGLVADNDGNIGVDAGDGGEGGEEGGDEGGDGEGGCFIGSTPVLMVDGSFKCIQDIVADDVVESQANGKTVPCRVTKLHRNIVPERMELFFDEPDSTIVTTPRQRFAILDSPMSPQQSEGARMVKSAFTEAEDLSVGSEIRLAGVPGRGMRLARKMLIREQSEVFNLSVDTLHTYVAGSQRLVVHNRKDRGSGPEEPV